MNKQPIEQVQDLDLQHSLAAMRRAALRAREVARQTGTCLVVSRNGVVELLAPDDQALDTPSVQEAVAPYQTGSHAR